MSYGFSFVTGSTNLVTIDASNNAPGLFVDTFQVAYNSTVSKSYPSFVGTQLFVYTTTLDVTKINAPAITINNSTKSVSITAPSQTSTARQVGFNVIVFGK